MREPHDCNFHDVLRVCINDRCPLHRALRMLSASLSTAAMLQRASDGAATRLMRRLLHAIEHDPTWHQNRGTRYELSCRVRTWWIANRGDAVDPPIADLIARSSVGQALADVKARGIDAHLADLEADRSKR